MAEISLPLAAVLAPFLTRISQWLFLETLKESNDRYLSWVYKDSWCQLGENVEFSTYLPTIWANEKNAFAQILVRSIDDEEVDEVHLLVESYNNFIKYQDNITVKNVSKRATVVSLPSIPLRAVEVLESGGIITSVSRLEISLLTVDDQGFKEKETVTHSLMNSEILNDRFIEKWDFYWNMAAIDDAYRDIRAYLHFHLCQQKYFTSQKMPIRIIVGEVARRLLGRPIFWVLSRNILIRIYFWLPILLKMKKFKAKK